MYEKKLTVLKSYKHSSVCWLETKSYCDYFVTISVDITGNAECNESIEHVLAVATKICEVSGLK